MVNKQVFRLKKNGEPFRNCFCRHPELIENYAEAMADKTQTWTCHHKFENLGFSGKQLVNMGMYYDVEPKDLIFMKESDHRALHNRIRGQSEESRKKISESKKGHKYGKYSIERRNNISKATKGRFKGAHWKIVDGKRVWY